MLPLEPLVLRGPRGLQRSRKEAGCGGDGGPPLTGASLLPSSQPLVGRRGASGLPLPGEPSKTECLVPRQGICKICLLTGDLRRWEDFTKA